jgi:hypothetical protein
MKNFNIIFALLIAMTMSCTKDEPENLGIFKLNNETYNIQKGFSQGTGILKLVHN